MLPVGPTEHVLFGLARWHSSGPYTHAFILCYFDQMRAYSKATRFVYLYIAFVVCPKCKVKGRCESCLVTFCCCWCLLPCIVHFAKFKFMCEHDFFLFLLRIIQGAPYMPTLPHVIWTQSGHTLKPTLFTYPYYTFVSPKCKIVVHTVGFRYKVDKSCLFVCLVACCCACFLVLLVL